MMLTNISLTQPLHNFPGLRKRERESVSVCVWHDKVKGIAVVRACVTLQQSNPSLTVVHRHCFLSSWLWHLPEPEALQYVQMLLLNKKCFSIITIPFIAQTNSSEMTDNCFVTMNKLGLETTWLHKSSTHIPLTGYRTHEWLHCCDYWGCFVPKKLFSSWGQPHNYPWFIYPLRKSFLFLHQGTMMSQCLFIFQTCSLKLS